MNIVVAGGTGFVGSYIARGLLDDGHQVTVLSRRGSTSGNTRLAGATAARADVTEPASLAGKLDGADAIVGVVQFPNYPAEVPRKGLTFDNYDRAGTENLIAAAKRAGVGRYLYLSGAGADPSSPKTWYRAKGRAETAVRSSGIDHCILRPSWAYGPGDKALNKFAAIARFSPIVPRIGVRPQLLQPVHVVDIARAAVGIFQRAAWGKTLEIGGPDVITMDGVIRTMLKVMRKRRLVVPIPVLFPKLAMVPLTLLPAPPMTPGGIEFAVQDAVVDAAEMTAALDVHPIPLEEGLSTYLSPA